MTANKKIIDSYTLMDMFESFCEIIPVNSTFKVVKHHGKSGDLYYDGEQEPSDIYEIKTIEISEDNEDMFDLYTIANKNKTYYLITGTMSPDITFKQVNTINENVSNDKKKTRIYTKI